MQAERPAPETVAALVYFGQAPSKDFIRSTLGHVAAAHSQCSPPRHLAGPVAAGLAITPDQAAQILALFPKDFPPQLGQLLTSIMASELPAWKNDAGRGRICLPRLVDFSCRVDLKTVTNASARMAVPAVVCTMMVADESNGAADSRVAGEGRRAVTFELPPATLDAVLASLGRIRDQLQQGTGPTQ